MAEKEERKSWLQIFNILDLKNKNSDCVEEEEKDSMVMTVWQKGMRWWRNDGWKFGIDGDGEEHILHSWERKKRKKIRLNSIFIFLI